MNQIEKNKLTAVRFELYINALQYIYKLQNINFIKNVKDKITTISKVGEENGLNRNIFNFSVDIDNIKESGCNEELQSSHYFYSQTN